MSNLKADAKRQLKHAASDAKKISMILEEDSMHDVLADLLEMEKEKPSDFDRAMADAKGFFDSRKVKLPADSRVTLSKNSPFRIRLCVNESCVSISVTAQ